MVFVLILLFLVFVGATLFLRSKNRSFPWFQFYLKGKESGFSFHEIQMLRKVAIQNKLLNPTSLFWSVKQLDRSIRGVILNARANDQQESEQHVRFLSKLFDFRKRVEFNLPKYRLGLKSTRNISPNQPIKITFPGGGVFYSRVIENMKRYLAISYPQGKKMPPGFVWKGQQINVYFWRAEDAGYYFETRVIDDFTRQKFAILHLTHSSNLLRAQKRRSLRRDVNRAGSLFPLRAISFANEEWEEGSGLRCRIINISEDGAAILVGGRAKPGLPLKLQLVLSDLRIVLCGIVKGVTYDHKKNQSILHIEAVPPGPAMKNSILVFVYQVFDESERGASALGHKLIEKPEVTAAAR